MRSDFDFASIKSVEFCVCVDEGEEYENYLIPCDQNVQKALTAMLVATVNELEEQENPITQHFEMSEKYAPKEALVADLSVEEMVTISELYAEEGWDVNADALQHPQNIPYYFVVFRDSRKRKIVGVRRATQFKGVVKRRLIRLIDDSLRMVGDNLFRLDNEFDFLITRQHAYILHPVGFERVAEIEEWVSAKAQEKAKALGTKVKFADFTGIAEFVVHHKRAARLVSALISRGGLESVKRSRFIASAKETGVALVNVKQKIAPAAGSEMGFLELLDDRRYTTAIKTGPKEAYVASSRRPVA